MTTLVIAALLAAQQPSRLVVGMRYPDLRRTEHTERIGELIEALQAVQVRRLSFALVVDVENAAEAEAELRGRHDVLWIEEDQFFEVALKAVPDDPLFAEQWHLHDTGDASIDRTVHIGAPQAWDESDGTLAGGGAARVAILDDGFDLDHPDLVDRFVGGCDVSGDETPVCEDDSDAGWEGGDLHGTQTAGIVGATGFNGLGVTGTCPACELIPIRLIGGGGPADLYTSGSAVAEALEWAVDQGADVINNSWGPPDGNPFDPTHDVDLWPKVFGSRPAGVLPEVVVTALRKAVNDGRGGLGTVVVWSSGNGNELVTYDRFAADPRVMTVGAIGHEGRRAYYSDYGPQLFVAAPSSNATADPKLTTTDIVGSDGLSADDYVDRYGGTSAATAIVSGVAALVIARYPDLRAAQVMEAIADSAFEIDPTAGDYVDGRSPFYGYGRIDARGAIDRAGLYDDDCTDWLDVCGNDRDDDCDGLIDENCEECIPDHVREACDGVDNNCDGANNEDFVCVPTDRPTCAPCTDSEQCNEDALCRGTNDFAGLWCFPECDAGQSCPAGYSCNGEVCLLDVTATVLTCDDVLTCAYIESCNGVDDDCNGTVDDIDLGGLEAAAEFRRCDRLGVCNDNPAACIDGAWVCQLPGSYVTDETDCDGLDNDCDGAIDEACDPDAGDDGCACGQNGSLGPFWAMIALLWGRRTSLGRRPRSSV